jgi:hypothetical protein
VTQHGPGAVIDLPELSVIVAGTNRWFPTDADRVLEPRLEAFLRVRALYRPPQPGPGRFGGVPAYVFPEWLVCPRCRKLAPHTDFSFYPSSGEFLCTRADSRHGRSNPAAFPARFMVTCGHGHLDDFPWHSWAHKGPDTCPGPLELIDTGSTGSASDLIVKCTKCKDQRPLGDAFQDGNLPPCTARRPWLAPEHHDTDGCSEPLKTILRGASNAYFPVVSSALSIPPWSDPIQQELAPFRERLTTVKSLEHLQQGIDGGFYDLGDLLERYSVEEIWKALAAEPEAESDLKRREYVAFLHPEAKVEPGTQFEISRRAIADRYADRFSLIVAAPRLREVRALRAFTRIDSIPDLGERTDVSELGLKIARLGLKDADWLPGIALLGEGIFLRLDDAALSAWESRPQVSAEGDRFAARFAEWRRQRNLDERAFPGMRYVLLHSLSHVLMRQLSLDCGYSSSALRERIYCDVGGDPMAGVLIYTASSDSEGSLGGLVDQAEPGHLGPLLTEALYTMQFCASDPLCGGAEIATAKDLNGAACHACLLLAETSCEFGNRLLDRATLVETLGNRGTQYFETP